LDPFLILPAGNACRIKFSISPIKFFKNNKNANLI
jgi:hypothetical protein